MNPENRTYSALNVGVPTEAALLEHHVELMPADVATKQKKTGMEYILLQRGALNASSFSHAEYEGHRECFVDRADLLPGEVVLQVLFIVVEAPCFLYGSVIVYNVQPELTALRQRGSIILAMYFIPRQLRRAQR